MRFLLHIPATIVNLSPVIYQLKLQKLAQIPMTENDRFVVGLGGTSYTTAEQLIKDLDKIHSLKPWISCGPKRIEVAKKTSAPRIAVDWEKTSVGADWDWNPIKNMALLQAAMEMCNPKKHGTLITGASLAQGYGWDFQDILEVTDEMVIQTQGFVRQKRITTRLNQIKDQVPVITNVYCEVVPGASGTPNAVGISVAIAACKQWPNWLLFGADFDAYLAVILALRED